MTRFDVRAAGPRWRFPRCPAATSRRPCWRARSRCRICSFLLAAQPTRGLDVGAVAAVYGHIRAACARGAGVLLISCELDELIAVADRIVVLYRGRIMGNCAADASERERDRRHDGGAGAMTDAALSTCTTKACAVCSALRSRFPWPPCWRLAAGRPAADRRSSACRCRTRSRPSSTAPSARLTPSRASINRSHRVRAGRPRLRHRQPRQPDQCRRRGPDRGRRHRRHRGRSLRPMSLACRLGLAFIASAARRGARRGAVGRRSPAS